MTSSAPLPEIRRPILKNLLDGESDLVRLLEAHNGLSGRVADSTSIQMPDGSLKEFQGIWVSGLTDSASMGLPDVELFGIQSRLRVIRELCCVTRKPIVVDGDSGGSTEQFLHSLELLCREGVSALIVEDKVFPKRNSLDIRKAQTLEDRSVFSRKISDGRRFLKNKDLLIIARTEALIAGMGMHEAMLRVGDYLEAGADAIVIHSRQRDPKEVMDFASEYHKAFGRYAKPLIAIPTAYNSISEAELIEGGFRMVIYANHLLRSALMAMKSVAEGILSNNRSLDIEGLCVPVDHLFQFVDNSKG